jgi:Zn-dependent peptidase ImmA (M78 family)/transcriptional regulator with XRE-family HTH domain
VAKRIEALVQRELLTWARKTAGFEIAQAAKKLQVPPTRLEEWEHGDARPSVAQLRKLARVYKRPLGVFYLPEPPPEVPPLHDFRRLPGEVAGVQSPELRFEIRRARSRRELALDLYKAVGGPPPAFDLSATLSDDREEVGIAIREALGIRFEEQIQWTGWYDPFNAWRSALETVGVLIFQATNVAVQEVRGFSIAESPLPAIVVNVKDSPRGRTFTMLHELAHLLIREGGLCDTLEEVQRRPEEQRVEVFCNHVAGAALVPRPFLLAEELVRSRSRNTEWPDEDIERLARRYGVSREVLLRRLLTFERITQPFYDRKTRQYREEYLEHAEQRAQGFAPPHQTALSAVGPFFARLVLINYHQERITASEVSDFLEVRLQHLPKIEVSVLGQSLSAGATT